MNCRKSSSTDGDKVSQQEPGAPEVRRGLLLLTCGFSPPALGLGCVLLPPAQGRATGLIGITKPLSHTDTHKKRGVIYCRLLEISLPGTKTQICDLSGFQVVLNIQSTSAEIRWCPCSICRKHTGSDAADTKITVPAQEIWLCVVPGQQMLFKAQADRKGKNKRLQKWKEISWVKSKVSKLSLLL